MGASGFKCSRVRRRRSVSVRAPFRDAIEPGDRVVRFATFWPCLRGACARFGERLLGDVEIAISGGKRGNDAPAARPRRPVKGAERQCTPTSNGRISIAPSPARGTFLAMAIAASRSGASMR